MIETETVERLVLGPKCTAAQSLSRVPLTPGYYTIFIDDGGVLPSLYGDLLLQRATSLIYIGIATVSLYGRLVEQDLQHRRSSTFFRGIGSILGYRPPRDRSSERRTRTTTGSARQTQLRSSSGSVGTYR